jgi:transcriptional regulator with XRE-family HTH domain
MSRILFIELVDNKLKLIRTEYNYSQEKMAKILGISKKGRSSLGWTAAVA